MTAKTIVLTLVCCTFLARLSNAQSTIPPYTDCRVCIFDFEIMQIRGKTVMLKCRFANTGRVAVGSKKTAADLVIELDSINLPAILWGHEEALTSAATSHLPRMLPGEISAPIWLNVVAKEPAVVTNPALNLCSDLVIDTAYVFKYSDDALVLYYEISNVGSAPVEIARKSIPFTINVYFVSGTKLTRGAIPTGNATIQLGRETLTGWLKPAQKLSGLTTVELTARSKFTPNLMLELATPPSINECNRTNNTHCIVVPF